MNKLQDASVTLAKALASKEDTREALALKLGISVSYISKLLSGNRIASMELCKKIKQVYPDLEALCLVVQMRKIDF